MRSRSVMRSRSGRPARPARFVICEWTISKRQAEAKAIASQVEALKAHVLADGARLEAELCFVDEGCSGGTLLRPAPERLRDQAAAGGFARPYVHSPDRLSRSHPYRVLPVEELQRQGVEIVFLNHDIGRAPEE